MIDPRTVMVGVPCHDGRNMAELTGMLISNKDLYGAITLPTECSHPSLVRNIMADTFLRSGYEWFVGIDSDIVPARGDFQYLLEPIDSNADGTYAEDLEVALDQDPRFSRGTAPPRPTRIEAGFDSGPRTLADVLVCAEYAYKRDEFEPVQFGGGFYRVHKSVFNLLTNLTHPDNGRVEVDQRALGQLFERIQQGGIADTATFALIGALKETQTSQAGTHRIWQCTHNGRMFYDFFPSGAMLSAGLPHGDWKGEDHGFWTLCSLAGLIPRVERRTRVIHIGRKGYAYEGGGQ